ncbi:MAG: type II toxin-antitoxin system VapC family toxin [Planctomycetes bacterium]|nr:type II toxin-antitoxin system VapC family toxin [Planctomycetota bacterium]
MILPDVNVLVYAFRKTSSDHGAYRKWLEAAVNAEEPFGVSDLVLSGFLRVVTHPAVFSPPDPLVDALRFVEALRTAPGAVRIDPGNRHWEIFTRLCRESGATGNMIPDAWLAALAIEWGCEWITTDRDYSRFRGLKWRHPLAGPPA